KRQSLKVQINATDDTVCMRYLRPSQNTKLEGFVLGYGSSFFSNQYIPLPSEGNTYINELGRSKNQKPLQLVVGTLTPTSVFLSWGILVNPQHDWTATSNCASDRFYTVRYREKDKDKKWVFQLCPVTETVVDNLKPNTLYEFGVKDNMEDSIWSKTFNHKTVLSNKKVNGQLQNMYKLVPNAQSQFTLRDNKKLVPVTIIKQVIQNRTQSKTSDSSSLPGAILANGSFTFFFVVHLIVPGINETQQKLLPPLSIDDITQVARKKLGKNETQVWPAESKTPEVQEISPQSLPGNKYSVFRNSTEYLCQRSSYGFLHVTSTPQTFTASEMTDTAFSDIQPVLSSPVTPSMPEIADTEPAPKPPLLEPKGSQIVEQQKATLAPKEIPRIPSKPKPSPKPHIPHSEDVPKEPHRIPSRPRPSPSSEVPQTKPGPKDSRRVTSKPRTSPSPYVQHTKPGIIPSFREPDTTMIPQIPERIKPTLAPKETLLTPSRPKISVETEVPQTKTALSKTTVAPARTKVPGLPKWIEPTTDDVYTPEDIARHIGMDVKKPFEYFDTWEKPISVTTPPRPQHPPIPPVKPTPMRRKPLPPNTVTGKPGIPAKPAGPTMPVKTGVSYKAPTAFATPEYYAPHVKYMKKDDDVPCSITSSLEHFPQEEAGIKEEPTRPPQNPPTNLTVVTVEGCPTFVILDWEKPDNDTVTEYEVVSTENGATDGEKEKSIITTNQTHSTVENLKPDTR
ncbi:hypothetical protein ASZ78_010420, partial [Callipepla squamata]